MPDRADISVVVATRNRRDRLLVTLERLSALPDKPQVIVVDNASSDGTISSVRAAYPTAELIALPENRGATARTAGVHAARTPFVAFSDDDSWWTPGALQRATEHLSRYPRLGLIAAEVLVGQDEVVDPVCHAMARSPITSTRPLPGPAVLGFVACGAVVRRCSYLQVGGFNDVLFFLGEERMLAFDLARVGWDLAYTDDVVAHHHPARQGMDPARQAQGLRNDMLTNWMRRPWPVVVRSMWSLVQQCGHDASARAALTGIVRKLPAAVIRRHCIPSHVEQQARLLDTYSGPGFG